MFACVKSCDLFKWCRHVCVLPVCVAIEIDLSRVTLLLVRTGEREMETETGDFGQ